MVKNQKKETVHETVLLAEVLSTFKVKEEQNQVIIDATLGTGGHAVELVKNGVTLLGIEIDPQMLEIARMRLDACPVSHLVGGRPYKLILGNFKDLDSIAKSQGFSEVNGVLFDLGVSNLHLKDTTRGFSFDNAEADLDMRLSEASQAVKAMDLLNVLRADQLKELFSKVLDYRSTQRLVDNIVKFRATGAFRKVDDLLAVAGIGRQGKQRHPATKAFLALRMAVNSELANLEEALPRAFALLAKGGKLCVISFHSGEDKIVKRYFADLDRASLGELVTAKPVIPTDIERLGNRRSRSAKMRVIRKV